MCRFRAGRNHRAVRHARASMCFKQRNRPRCILKMMTAILNILCQFKSGRYFKHRLPVQIRLTHVRVECAIILISMACQRTLILDYDVQDALIAGGQSWKRITWHPITKCQIETRKASLFLFSFISVSLECSISACSG